MTADELRQIGEKLYGPQWQAKLSRALPVNPRTVRSWLSGRREIPEENAERIRALEVSGKDRPNLPPDR
jgi:DNA-binding transcriptional regulator YdaS (Cro superfamily)